MKKIKEWFRRTPKQPATPVMKPIEEWLQQLPDGYRERALSQLRNTAPQRSLIAAVQNFEFWEQTKEGYDFWGKVWNHYLTGSPLPKLPTE